MALAGFDIREGFLFWLDNLRNRISSQMTIVAHTADGLLGVWMVGGGQSGGFFNLFQQKGFSHIYNITEKIRAKVRFMECSAGRGTVSEDSESGGLLSCGH